MDVFGELRLHAPAEVSTLSDRTRLVLSFLLAHDVAADTANDVRLCVHECCANAILHSGSRADIDVNVMVNETRVTVLVADSGRGMDIAQYHPERALDLMRRGHTSGFPLFIACALQTRDRC
jgi:anti-sigma regulatory factor (Ser/Thr protein kinase)